LPDLNQIWIFSTDFHKKCCPISNFTERLPVGTALIYAGRGMNGYDVGDRRFCWLCERA